jgi:hypothetical protein
MASAFSRHVRVFVVAMLGVAAALGSWSCSSDRNLKQNLVPLDGKAVLDKLVVLPIYAWSPRGSAAQVRHIGPMAQDFHAAYGLGDSDVLIGMQDADGVALAAIQGLHAKLDDKDREIANLRAALSALEAKIERFVAAR